MIDIHCHLLPGVDDGAVDMAEAEAMALLATADGTTDLVVTPHFRHYRWPNEDRAELEERFTTLRDALADRPRLALGAEIRVDSELLDDLERRGADAVLPMAGSRYLLLEFETLPIGPEPEDIVREVRLAGWWPILAHPERLPWLAEEPERLAELVEAGAFIQVTALSVTGDFGWRTERCCRFLLDHDLLHFVASDGHDRRRRPPVLSGARARIAGEWGEETARRVTVDNPAAVLADREIGDAAELREAAR